MPRQRRNIKYLENLIKKYPSEAQKIAKWTKEIENLKSKPKQRPKQSPKPMKQQNKPIKQKVLPNLSNTSIVAGTQTAKSDALSVLAMQAGSYLTSLVDADSGAARIPDSVSDETALYHSIMEFPISANTATKDGRFTVIIQPILGSSSRPRYYKIAYMNPDSAVTDFTNPEAFHQSVNGGNITVDPNLRFLTSGSQSQCTFDGVYTCSTSAATTNQQAQSGNISGNNNFAYDFLLGGVASTYGFIPEYSSMVIPAGTLFHSFYSSFTSAAGNWFANSQQHKFANNTNVISKRFRLMAYTEVTNTQVELSSFTIEYTPSGTGTGSVHTTTSGEQILYPYGTICMASGAGSTPNNDYGSLVQCNFYTTLRFISGTTYYIQPYFPNMPQTQTVTNVQYRYDITTSVLVDSVEASDALLQRLRPTSMKVHYFNTLSDINAGGNIAICQLPGSYQKTVFSKSGVDFTSYTSITASNRVRNLYSGNLKFGAYGFWTPEQNLDYSLYTYDQTLEYEYPFYLVTGNLGGGTTYSGNIATIRVVTNFEFTTMSTLFDTKSCLGYSTLADSILSTVNQQPKCMENPIHPKVLRDIVNFSSRVVGQITNILPHISTIIGGVGAALKVFGI